ncbi:MAG: VWA domain-containing protein [Ruminococcaceae bacterium]|nr:VWA domain-containing protein [Oscillospiraceae bacterium]
MVNFSIQFSNPWFLLLLIPALFFALLPYFRMNKRYRKTRNRITSIALHITVMVLSVCVLAGITFEYDLPNKENEVILLVDTSDSGSEGMEDKNDFVKSVIDNTDSMFKLGIVTFGFDQVYAVELSDDTENMYTQYLQAPAPNNSATDIASALSYAASLFTKKETARIVLISDAVETDGQAINIIKTIASQGIKVDTVHFPAPELGDEVQIVDATRPNEKITVGNEFFIDLTLQSSYAGTVTITPFDNNAEGEGIEVELKEGLQTVKVPFAFTLPGLHTLSFEINSDQDTEVLNNVFTSYMYLEIFDKILVVESIESESQSLCTMLRDELNVTVVNVHDPINMPKTTKELRAFDQVVLCNISNADMPDGFADSLYSYVYDFGGGLFTICGNKEDLNPNDEDWTANAYTKEDMYGTTYQKLLPVEIINYTPPVAVIIIIDRSGSMYDGSGKYEESKLYYAKQGAEACLDALTERDFVGIMSLGDSYNEELELTPRPYRAKILSAIERIEGGGNTVFSDAIERAGKALAAKTGVEKKHIIIVTDGEPSGDNEGDYTYWMQENAKQGITTSIVGVQCTTNARRNMIELLKTYAGGTEKNFHDIHDVTKVPEAMREDLEVPEIKDVNYVTFTPTFGTTHSITAGINEEDMPTLDGYYGVKAKEGAQVVIMGDYTPIYTQWQCGKGSVGTFACDLNGTWSADFVESPVGATLINNIVTALFPTDRVRPQDIDAEVDGDNYSTVVSVFTDMQEGDYIELEVKSPGVDGEEGLVQTITASSNDSYSRLSFAVTTPGLHEIKVTRKSADGIVIAETIIYKALPYSQEYNLFTDPATAEQLIQTLATHGRGAVLEEPLDVFENALKYIHRVIDPKIVFMVTALALFLLDIAARKFKWKWPHEIIRDKKARAAMTK